MDESVSFKLDCVGGDRKALSWQESVLKGARFEVAVNVSKVADGVVRMTLHCNKRINMKECRSTVDATIRIETGEEGDPHYTKYEFPSLFGSCHQDELFEYNNGEIFRNQQLEDDKTFDTAALPGFLHFTIIVNRVDGPRALPIRKEWDHLSPDCRHDKVIVLDDGTRFYVLSQILSASSSYFNNLFNNAIFESKQEELSISGVSKEAFQKMLQFIYPFHTEPDDLCDYEGVEELLQIGDRFDIPVMMDEVLWWIMEQQWFFFGRRAIEVMKWADHYDLLELHEKANFGLSRTENLHQVIFDNYDYVLSLPLSTREKIFHALYLQQREEVEKKERENKRKEKEKKWKEKEKEEDASKGVAGLLSSIVSFG